MTRRGFFGLLCAVVVTRRYRHDPYGSLAHLGGYRHPVARLLTPGYMWLNPGDIAGLPTVQTDEDT